MIRGTLTKMQPFKTLFFWKLQQKLLSDPSCSVQSDCVHMVTFYSTCDQFEPTLLKLIRGLSQESRWTEEPCSAPLPSFPGHYGHKASTWIEAMKENLNKWSVCSASTRACYICYFSVAGRPSSPLAPPPTVHHITSPA